MGHRKSSAICPSPSVPCLSLFTCNGTILLTFLWLIMFSDTVVFPLMLCLIEVPSLQFWKAFYSLIGASVRLSSSFYPQSNDQMEWVNQQLETTLCCMATGRPSTWSSTCHGLSSVFILSCLHPQGRHYLSVAWATSLLLFPAF